MKISELPLIHTLTGAVMGADRQIKEAGKRIEAGHADMPCVSYSFDQSDAKEIPEVIEARERLRERIVAAFKEYRNDIIKIVNKYINAKD